MSQDAPRARRGPRLRRAPAVFAVTALTTSLVVALGLLPAAGAAAGGASGRSPQQPLVVTSVVNAAKSAEHSIARTDPALLRITSSAPVTSS